MAAVTSISLADAQVTPVVHVFIPLEQKDGVWWFEDQTGVNPLGFQRIALSLVRPNGASIGATSQTRVSRFKAAIHMPRLETLGNAANGLTPAPTLGYKLAWSVEGILPERALLQDRKDGRKYVVGLLGDPQVVAMIETLQSIY